MGKLFGRIDRGLTLYVRHLAWLHATPKPDPRSKRAKHDQAPKLSRFDAMKRDGIKPLMPSAPIPHIIDRLLEVGIVESTGMGAVPLSWREIVAWQEATGLRIPAWEARLLRRLSTAYVSESRLAESENCPPPFAQRATAREIETEVDRLRMLLG